MLLLTWSAFWATPTFDEPFHLLRGLNYWWQGDMRAYYAEPPLFNALTSLPAALTIPEVDLHRLHGWPALGRATPDFLATDYNAIRAAIQLGRALVLSVYALMMLLSYLLCLRVWGLTCARLVLVLLCFEPLLLAHGHLLTTDLGLTAGLLATTYATILYLRTPGLRPWLWLTAAVTCCILTKTAGLAVGPLAVLIVFLRASVRGRRFRAQQRKKRLVRAGLEMLATGATVLLAINLAFGFDRTGMTVAETLREPDARRRLESVAFFKQLPQDMPIPLPYMYTVNLVHVQLESRVGRKTYFQGTWRDRGTPRYYPTLLLVQGSPTLLGLLLLAFFLLVRRKKLSEPSQVIAAYAIGWLALMMTSRVNIGFRHALPIVPLLSLLAARAGVCLLADPYLRRAQIYVYTLIVCAPITGLLAAPRFLGYFNPLGGTAKHAHTVNLIGEDWGQDLRDLAAYADEHPTIDLYYHEYRPGLGLRELAFLGVDHKPLECKKLPQSGVAAVHATVVLRGQCFPELTRESASRRINEHVLLYELPLEQ